MSDNQIKPKPTARWTFSKQHRECRENGTKQSMAPDRFERLGSEDRQFIEHHRKFWGGESRGLGFCGMVAGICCLSHCKQIGNVKV